MGSHPLNLTFRFLLELAALFVMGIWGWRYSEGWLRYVLTLGVPLSAALIWGIFAVPNDPSRSGVAPIAVPGLVRLVIEMAIFSLAIWALIDMGSIRLGWAFGLIAAIHYLVSYDRILWLLRQ